MTGVVRAELRKITTTRGWWILLICVAVLGGGYAVLPAVTAVLQSQLEPNGGGPSPLADPGILRSIYNGGNTLSRILALVLGVMIIGGEFRHGTITSTYLATPRRGRVIAAKSVAGLIFGLLYGAVSVLMGVVVAIPFVITQRVGFALDLGSTWRSLLLGVISIGLWTLLGFAIGLLIENMVVALLVGIGFVYLVEPSLTVVFALQGWSDALNLMPSGATNALLEVTSPILFAGPDPYAWWQGLLVLAGWTLLPAVFGVLFTVGRDVT